MAGGSAVNLALQSPAGVRKAAILLIQLGRDRASQVMSHLDEADVERISSEIARLESVSGSETEQVLAEFRDMALARAHISRGGLEFAQQLLEQSLGKERAAEIMERLNAAAVQMPFQFLHRADPTHLRGFIVNEPPQVIALVLAPMTPEKASLLLTALPHALQGIG